MPKKSELKLNRYELVPIDSVKLDPSNPNVMSKEQMAALGESMKRFGYLTPIVIDQHSMIADGEHRLEVYRRFGKADIPAIRVNLKTDEDRRLIRQVMNKLHGEHDRRKDADEMKVLYDSGRLDDLAALVAGDKEDYLRLLERYHDIPFVKEEEEITEAPEAVSKRGQVWKLGRHRLMCGDSKDPAQVLSLLEGAGKVTLLLIDPPYGINIISPIRPSIGGSKAVGFSQTSTLKKRTHFASSSKSTSGTVGGPGIVSPRIYSHGVPGDDEDFDPEPYLNYGEKQIIFGANHFANRLPNNSIWLVWDKKIGVGAEDDTFSDVELMWTNFEGKKSRIYRHLWAGLLRAGPRDVELTDRVHPTQKPVGLLAKIISDYTQEQDAVMDLFGGSGSTLIACEQLDRTCYMMEIEPHYCDVIIQRWETLTGKKAEKVA